MNNEMLGKSPWRRLLYPELKQVSLSGTVLDLGGSHNSDYHKLFGGTHVIRVANNDKDAQPDFLFDFEQVFPISEREFDAVLSLNTLEHIFNYAQFLSEVKRVLKPKGRVILAVPFLVQVHPSPSDFFRYSEQALMKMLESEGFVEVIVTPVGRGPFTASAQMLYNALRVAPLRSFAFVVALGLDKCLNLLTSMLKGEGANHSSASFYPLGYLVTAMLPE